MSTESSFDLRRKDYTHDRSSHAGNLFCLNEGNVLDLDWSCSYVWRLSSLHWSREDWAGITGATWLHFMCSLSSNRLTCNVIWQHHMAWVCPGCQCIRAVESIMQTAGLAVRVHETKLISVSGVMKYLVWSDPWTEGIMRLPEAGGRMQGFQRWMGVVTVAQQCEGTGCHWTLHLVTLVP